MTATRVSGWRTGRRRRPVRGEDWTTRQARQYADAFRVRSTQACERVLRQSYKSAATLAAEVNRDLRNLWQAVLTTGGDPSELDIETQARDLQTRLQERITAAAAEIGEPADALAVEVRTQPTDPRLVIVFKMPEHSDHERLQGVLRELAAQHGGKTT